MADSAGFANARIATKSVVYNGYLYLIGGTPNWVVYYSDVQYAAIQSNGCIGTWQTTSNMITGLAYHAAVTNNDICM